MRAAVGALLIVGCGSPAVQVPNKQAAATFVKRIEDRDKAEVEDYYYREVHSMLVYDNRMKPFIDKVMTDGKITDSEWMELRDRHSEQYMEHERENRELDVAKLKAEWMPKSPQRRVEELEAEVKRLKGLKQ